VVVFGGAGARGAQDDKSEARIEVRVKVKGDGQECPSHTIKAPGIIERTFSWCAVRRAHVRGDSEAV